MQRRVKLWSAVLNVGLLTQALSVDTSNQITSGMASWPTPVQVFTKSTIMACMTINPTFIRPSLTVRSLEYDLLFAAAADSATAAAASLWASVR